MYYLETLFLRHIFSIHFYHRLQGNRILDPYALHGFFKVFGLLGITLVFTVVQALFLAKHFDKAEKENS